MKKIIIALIVVVLLVLGIFTAVNIGSVTQSSNDECKVLEADGRNFQTMNEFENYMNKEYFTIDVDEYVKVFDIKVVNGKVNYCDTLVSRGESIEQ